MSSTDKNTLNITITDAAAQHIKALMDKAPEEAVALRLGIKTTGCSGNAYDIKYVEQAVDSSVDDEVKDNGAVLYIPKIYSWMLIGMTIDFITDELGNSRFDFVNPNETGRCGCGESFTVQR